MNEEWRIYKKTIRSIWEVSNFGRVKLNGEIYECKIGTHRYLKFGGGYVHRAVAELYVPNPNNYNEVDHIDGNKKNNYYLNLRWCTHKQNCNNQNTIMKRENHFMYNKHHSEETRNKISESLKGNKNMVGKIHSEEHKKKISESMKGKFKGRHVVLCEDGKRHWTDK